MRLIRLDAKSEACWAHLPALKREVAEAGAHFHQKGCAVVLDRVIANFVAKGLAGYDLLSPDQQQADTTALWYFWDDETHEPRGHLLALQGEFDGETVVYVYQLWVVRAMRGLRVNPDIHALQDTAALELDHYVRSRGASKILMYTKRPARYWGSRFGFVHKRCVYEREVAP